MWCVHGCAVRDRGRGRRDGMHTLHTFVLVRSLCMYVHLLTLMYIQVVWVHVCAFVCLLKCDAIEAHSCAELIHEF